jgi:hypothetical protein
MISCHRSFYSMPRILRRVWGSLWGRRQPLISLVGNLSYRNNLRLNRKAYADFRRQRGKGHDSEKSRTFPCAAKVKENPLSSTWSARGSKVASLDDRRL